MNNQYKIADFYSLRPKELSLVVNKSLGFAPSSWLFETSFETYIFMSLLSFSTRIHRLNFCHASGPGERRG